MATGQIKKIIFDRGYGFVKGDDGNEVFFHRTETTEIEFDSLREGEQVEYEVADNGKGPRARNLKRVS